MRWQYTDRFQRAYNALQDADAGRVEKAITLLAGDLRYPGLRVKKVQGTEGIWEARASLSLRMTFEIHGDLIILRNVGLHDEVLRNP